MRRNQVGLRKFLPTVQEIMLEILSSSNKCWIEVLNSKLKYFERFVKLIASASANHNHTTIKILGKEN